VRILSPSRIVKGPGPCTVICENMICNGYHKSLLSRADSILYISMRKFLMIFNVLRIINHLCWYSLYRLIGLDMPEVMLFFRSPHGGGFPINVILLSLKRPFWISFSDHPIHLYWICLTKFGRSFYTWLHSLGFMSLHLGRYLLMSIEKG
jgi:hypothetical protein